MILCALQFFAPGCNQRPLGQEVTIGLSQSSVSRAILKVTRAINSVLLKKCVSFPTQGEYSAIKANFAGVSEFPGVVGVVDGTHIAIIAPSSKQHPLSEVAHFNRKGYHCLNVQLVCDDNCRFINVNALYPGSNHDSFIWKNSRLRQILRAETAATGQPAWLLGDSGYPLEPWLLTPIARPCNASEELYNQCHKKTRSVIGRAIGILKGRFRCFLRSRTLAYSPETMVLNVNACVCLHMCRNAGICLPDGVDPSSEDGEDDDAHTNSLDTNISVEHDVQSAKESEW